MELLILKKFRLIFLLFIFSGTLSFLFYSCPDSELPCNPNDPYSKCFISDSIASVSAKRVSLNTAQIRLNLNNHSSQMQRLNVTRLIKNNSRFLKDTCYKLPFKTLIHEGDSVFSFSDSTLTFQTQYKYKILMENDNGIKDDTCFFSYNHGYQPIYDENIEILQHSDIKLQINIIQPDTIADSIKIIWESGNYIDSKIIERTDRDSVCFHCHSGQNDLENNKFYIQYGSKKREDFVWYNILDSLDYKIQFPSVNNLSIVHFNSDSVRITWNYPQDVPVVPTNFIIKNGEHVDSSFVTQKIIGYEPYVCYMENNINKFIILPKTKYHFGDSVAIDFNDSSIEDDFYFVDTARIGNNWKGFYISKYEVTNENFKNFLDNNKQYEQEINTNITDFDSSFGLDEDLTNKPVRGIPFEIAKEYANFKDADLPTKKQWEIAALGNAYRSDIERKFPWGNSMASKSKANYINTYGNTINTKSCFQGRTIINQKLNLYGAYNMSGNVMEWTKDTSACYSSSTLPKTSSNWGVCKGGSWLSSDDLITIEEDYPIPQNDPTQEVGIRLIK